MSHIAWHAAVNTSMRFESRRICWIVSIAATPSGVSRNAFESACQAISSARILLPGPSGSIRAMSIQFLKISRPDIPSFAAAQLITTDRVRSGYLPATTIAIIPPIEVPWMWAWSRPRASIRPATSSAQTSMSYSCTGRSDCP